MDLDGIEVKWSKSYSVVSDSLQPHGLYSPGQNTGVGSLSLLQGIFPTQGYNPGLPHCRRILYQLSHEGSPRILEWVAYPFSSRSSQPRVSFIAGRFFTNWATREAQGSKDKYCIIPLIYEIQNKQANLETQRAEPEIARNSRWGVGNMGESGQEIQTSSFKISKFWVCNALHGGYS